MQSAVTANHKLHYGKTVTLFLNVYHFVVLNKKIMHEYNLIATNRLDVFLVSGRAI